MVVITFRQWALALCILYLLAQDEALVIYTSTGTGLKSFQPASKEVAQNRDLIAIRVRIRTARESDIVQVSNLLSNALVSSSSEANVVNWRIKLEVLKSKAGVETLLRSRMLAIRAGQKLSHVLALPDLSEFDRLRLLWSHDTLRNKIENAARLSSEPHIWKHHANFALAPGDPDWLQHKMIAAEDAASGEIIGFCEVAMLSLPMMAEGDEGCSVECAPTIVNLVTSPKHRRRGIASSLVKTASRLVQQHWSTDELNLYVDKDNTAALTMYSKLGFEKSASIERDSRPQWYMRHLVSASSSSSQERDAVCISPTQERK
jgi:ribosomal protein S18 acetylase RimI-like enzyme